MFHGRLSRKLVTYIVVISGFFTLLTTGYAVYSDYQSRMATFEEKIETMTKSFVRVAGIAIYKKDMSIVGEITHAFTSLSEETAVSIKNSDATLDYIWSPIYGTFDRKNAPETAGDYFVYELPLELNNYFSASLLSGTQGNAANDAPPIFIGNMGTIEVIAHRQPIRDATFQNIKVILITQAIKVFFVTFIVLFIIHRLVVTRQTKITAWLNTFSHDHSVDKLQLRRVNEPDEIDDMADTINTMSDKIKSHQLALEQEVAHRTRELLSKNKELEDAKRELHHLLQTKNVAIQHIEDTLSTWVWRTDVFGNLSELSSALEKLVSNGGNKIRHLHEIVHVGEDNSRLKEVLQLSQDQREPFVVQDAQLQLNSGESLIVRLEGKPSFIDGEYKGFTGNITDVSTEKKLSKLAFTDGLTGVANRIALEEHFDKTKQRAQRLKFDIGLMLLDLDFFKSINDNYGHATGDEVLKAFALTVQQCIRDEDRLARIGGEEFAVIVQGATSEGLVSLAQRINESVESLKLPSLPAKQKITVSIGFTILNETDLLEDGLNRADKYLYEAKRAGRNRYASDII